MMTIVIFNLNFANTFIPVPLQESETVRRHTIQITTSLDRLLEQTRSWRMVLDAAGVEKVREMTSRLLDSVRRVAAHLAKLLMVWMSSFFCNNNTGPSNDGDFFSLSALGL